VELVWPMETGICRTGSASLAMCGTRRRRGGKKNTGAKVIAEAGLLQILRDDWKISSRRSDMMRWRCPTLMV